MSFQIQYVYNLIDKVSPSLKKIAANIKASEVRLRRSADRMSSSFEKIAISAKKAGKSIRDSGRKIRGLGTEMLPLSGFTTLSGIAAVKTAAQFETLALKMEVLTGSAAKGKKLFDEVVKTAAQTPYELTDLTKATTKLMGYGVSAEDVVKHLKLIGDVAAISGGDVDGITTAFGQAAASGRLMGIDLLQFVNNGVPMIKMLSDSLKVPKERIKDMVSDGKITFPVLIKAFENATASGGMFEGGMNRLSKTLTGLYSTLKDEVTIALADLGNEIVTVLELKDKIKDFTISISRLTNKFRELSPTTKKIIIYIGLFTAVLAPLLIIIGLVASGVGAMITVFSGLVTAFGVLGTILVTILPILKMVFAVLIANPIGLIITGIVALVLVIKHFQKRIKDLGMTLSDLPSLALDSFRRTFPNIFKLFDFLIEKIVMVKDFFMNTFGTIISGIASAVSSFKSFAGFGDQNIERNTISQNYLTMAQAKQSINVDGRVGIDVSLPKGSSAAFTPAPNNNINMGLTGVFAQ